MVDSLIMAFDQIVTRAGTHGLRVYGATLPPFGGHTGYDDGCGLRERARQAVNHWIRTSGRFDEVVDFDAATRDPQRPGQLRSSVDGGDHLHLNLVGLRALADAVPLRLFHPRSLPAGGCHR